MDEKTLRALVEAGALKRISIVADGAHFYVEAQAGKCTVVALTGKGAPKTWRTLDAAARWVRGLGLGEAMIDVSRWRPDQRALPL